MLVLGPACFAASLALFGAEHIVSAPSFMQIVPPWMPARLFWAYFVGFALIAAALSIVFNRFVRLSTTLLAVMFFLFVAMLHAPRVVENSADRIAWTVLIRDSGFAAGALALSITAGNSLAPPWLSLLPRLVVAVALIEFGVQYLLHPESAPGVPLTILTPAWVPLPKLWGYLGGIALLACGIAMFFNSRARLAAAWAGGALAFFTLFVYLPMFALSTTQFTLGMNGVGDTLLFGAAAWLVAEATPAIES
jgi:uncharacterized membrane protein